MGRPWWILSWLISKFHNCMISKLRDITPQSRQGFVSEIGEHNDRTRVCNLTTVSERVNVLILRIVGHSYVRYRFRYFDTFYWFSRYQVPLSVKILMVHQSGSCHYKVAMYHQCIIVKGTRQAPGGGTCNHKCRQRNKPEAHYCSTKDGMKTGVTKDERLKGVLSSGDCQQEGPHGGQPSARHQTTLILVLTSHLIT